MVIIMRKHPERMVGPTSRNLVAQSTTTGETKRRKKLFLYQHAITSEAPFSIGGNSAKECKL